MVFFKKKENAVPFVVDDDFFNKFERKCANNHAHEFLNYINYNRQNTTYANAIRQIGRSVDFKLIPPPRKMNINKEIAGDLVCEFYAKYLPQKAEQVQQIINKTHPLFLDKTTNTYQIFIVEDATDNHSNVGNQGKNTFLTLNCNITHDTNGPRVLAHEIAHAISKHHQYRIELVKKHASNEEFIKYTSAMLGKDCIGEIESHIVENLFNNFMLKKGLYTPEDIRQYNQEQQDSLLFETNLILEESDIIANLSGPPVKKENLKNLQQTLIANNNQTLLRRMYRMANEKQSSQFMFRYVVGRVVADAWMNKFNSANTQEQRQMLNNFNNYLDNTHELTLDAACKTLLDKDFVGVVQDYITKEDSKTDSAQNNVVL